MGGTEVPPDDLRLLLLTDIEGLEKKVMKLLEVHSNRVPSKLKILAERKVVEFRKQRVLRPPFDFWNSLKSYFVGPNVLSHMTLAGRRG